MATKIDLLNILHADFEAARKGIGLKHQPIINKAKQELKNAESVIEKLFCNKLDKVAKKFCSSKSRKSYVADGISTTWVSQKRGEFRAYAHMMEYRKYPAVHEAMKHLKACETRFDNETAVLFKRFKKITRYIQLRGADKYAITMVEKFVEDYRID